MVGTISMAEYAHKHLKGHWSFGRWITLYGSNAMSWAVNIHTKRWGYICFTIPFLSKWPFYFYCSPNATPWASTFYFGRAGKRGFQREGAEAVRAKVRRTNFGHNFNTSEHWNALTAVNNKFESLWVTEYDIERFGDKGD